MIPLWPYLILAYQLELALACVDAWEFAPAPARPRLEPEVCPMVRARRMRERANE
jgi:hypothetical protein